MLLVLETLTWKPHIETAMDIAMQRVDAGERVVYCSLREGLPACEDQSPVHALLDLPATRTRRAGEVLAAAGVDFRVARYDVTARRRASRLAKQMLSGCRDVSDVKALAYEGYHDLGWGVLSSVVSVTRDSSVALRGRRAQFKRYCAAAILVYDEALRMVDDTRPDELLLFNGRFATTRAVLRAAQARGIPWRIHERGGNKGRFWLTDCLPHDMDAMQDKMLQAWRPELAECGHRFFRKRRGREEQSWHSFSAQQLDGLLPEPMRAEGDWVTFFTSAEDEMFAIGDSVRNEHYPDQVGAIRAAARIVERIPGLRLCVRVHPHVAQKSAADQKKWRELDIPGALLIGASERFDSYALVDRSRATMCYGSTVGIEATYWERPSLCFSRSFYDRLGACELARDDAQVEAFLREPRVFPREATLPYGAFWDQLGQPYVHYHADDLHRGSINGVYLDDGGLVGLARGTLGTVRKALGLGHP
jgi:hypothetical protein